MSDDLVFNEDSLRAAIVAIWGKHGAHVDVFDMMLKVIRSSGDELSAQAATIAELRAENERLVGYAADLRLGRDEDRAASAVARRGIVLRSARGQRASESARIPKSIRNAALSAVRSARRFVASQVPAPTVAPGEDR